MLDSYKHSDFFMLLKLGLWTEGTVKDTGRVKLLYALPANGDGGELSPVHGSWNTEAKDTFFPFTRKIDVELDQAITPKQVGIGVSLLDFYPSFRDQAERQIEYIALFSVYRFSADKPDVYYYIRIRAHEDANPLDGLFGVDMPLKVTFYHSLFPRTSPFRRAPKYVNFYRVRGDRIGRSNYKF